MLQRLGPTYVKIGQMMASRRDVLPAEWTDELSKLQSDAAPFAYEDVVAIVTKELGSPPEVLYGTFDPIPFAAASTAQVHQARLHDGTLVAVKVQRPRIQAKTQADLGVIQELARVAERRIGVARKIGLSAIVGEFAQGVLKELDYRNEAYHARRLADGMQRFPEIHIPTVYDELSGQRVITMEFVNGIKISKADELRAAGFDTSELGTVFIRAIIKQVLVDGFFHGDPHPGNILADPISKQIIFLDLGLVGQLNAQQRVDLLGLIYSIKEVDIPGIGDGLLALGKPTRQFDEAAYRNDIDRLARQYLIYGSATSLGSALGGFLGAVFDNGLRLDSQLTLAMKAVIQAEETARALSFDIDLGEAAVSEARAAFMDSFTPEKIQKQLQGSAVRIGKELARRVPSLESADPELARPVQQGQVRGRDRHEGPREVHLERLGHRPPGDGRRHRGRAADRHGDRDGDPAPAVAVPVRGRRLHRDDRVRRDAGGQLRRALPAVLRTAEPRRGPVGPRCAITLSVRRDRDRRLGVGVYHLAEGRLGDRDG